METNPFLNPQTANQGGLPTSSSSDEAPTHAITTIDNSFSKGNPFGTAYMDYQNGVWANNFYKGTQDANAAIEANLHPSIGTQIKDTVRGLPGAFSQILQAGVNHPINTGESMLGGAADVGPAALNTLSAFGKGMLSFVFGNDATKDTGFELPMPGQTINEYIGNNSDAQKAIQLSSKQVAAYELGGAGARGIGLLPGILSTVTGNVLGGQMTMDPNASAKDRALQGTFDAAFGVAQGVGGNILNSIKGAKIVSQALEDSKGVTMNNAIEAFKEPNSSTFNPDVAEKLQGFMDTKGFDDSKNLLDFEKNLKNYMGDTIKDPKVADQLQNFIQSGKMYFNDAITSVKGAKPIDTSVPTKLAGPTKFSDVLKDNFSEAADAKAKAPAPQTKYVPKDDLGVDENGEKRLATTNYDHKTGNAIVNYDKSLDSNPQAKQIVLDHENGHILDKRLNGGDNFSTELLGQNPQGANVEKVMNDFAKNNSMSPEEATVKLGNDIKGLTDAKTPSNEKFAEAVSQYKADPESVAKKAPTFAAFMEHVPNEGQFSEHSTTLEGLKDQSPMAGHQVDKALQEAKTVEKPVDTGEKPSKEGQIGATKEPAGSSKIADTGLDTGKRVTDRSSFNADKMNTSKDVEVLLNKLDAENKNFGDQRVSKSNADLKDLARVVGLTPDELAAAKPGSIANSETILQARQLVLNQAEKVSNLTKELNLKTASDVQLQGLRDEFLKLVALQKGVAGFRTEASNALRSFGIELAPDENITLRQLLSVLKDANIASNDDAALFAEKAAQEFKMTPGQKIAKGALKTWYASILSGPATPIRHGLSVGSNILTDIASKAANPKTWNEVIPAASAFFKSLGDGWDTFKETLAGKLPEPEQFQALENVKEPIFTGKFAGYGKVVEGVGRFMDAAAAGYTKIAENVEKASLEVGSKEMSQEVTDAMTKDYGDFINYRGEPRGAVSRALMKGATATTKEAPILKVFVPFVKTVSNVLDRQFDYLPGTSYWRASQGFLARQADQIMNKFDLTSEADRTAILGRLQDQQVGRAVLGTTIATAGFIAASKGLISGAGPANYNKKLQLEQSGWRANSIKIGDTWVPYIYLGPLGGVLSMVGNMSDAVQYNNAKSADLSSSLVKGIVGFTKSQLDRSFLKGVSDLLNVLSDRTDPGKYLTQLGTGLIPIPKLLTSTTQEIRSTMSAITGDPTYSQQYETRNIVDAIRAKLGLQGDVFGTMKPLEPKLDAFGRPMTSDIIYGVTPKNTTGDKVDVFLNSNDLVVTRPLENAKYTIPGTKTQTTLTPEEYTNYLQDSGKQIYEEIAGSMKEMAQLPPDEQKTEIQSIVSSIRTDVRDQILLDRNKK